MKAKIGALFLVLMIGMAGIGASYAYWTKQITLTGTVATGTFGIEWSPIESVVDNEQGYPDTATCVADRTDADSDGKYDTVTITIDNAYPSYRCTIVGDITNYGTVPPVISLTATIPTELEVTPSGLFAVLWNGGAYQMSTGENAVWDLEIHVPDGAEQGSTYTIDLQVDAKQFNAP